jgi:hypothetical protein
VWISSPTGLKRRKQKNKIKRFFQKCVVQKRKFAPHDQEKIQRVQTGQQQKEIPCLSE